MEEDAASDAIDTYDDKYRDLTGQIKALQSRKNVYTQEQMQMDSMQQRFDELENVLNTLTNGLLQYDDIIVKDMIEKVIVVSKEKVIVKFKVGYEREETLNE